MALKPWLRKSVRRDGVWPFIHSLPAWSPWPICEPGSAGANAPKPAVWAMNKASCLSLVSNAIFYWNTVKISEIVDRLRAQGEDVSDEDLSHISLLRFKHVRIHGTYFIDEQ